MGKNSNKIKSDFLGIPYGTAQNQLRKIILFDLVKKSDLNKCFKCGLGIENIEDFSIEHKEPWLHIDKELYWSLKNISFSHLKCNRPDRVYKKTGPEGTSWCKQCKSFLNIDNFPKDKNTPNGLRQLCKKCHANNSRERRKNKQRADGKR